MTKSLIKERNYTISSQTLRQIASSKNPTRTKQLLKGSNKHKVKTQNLPRFDPTPQPPAEPNPQPATKPKQKVVKKEKKAAKGQRKPSFRKEPMITADR